MFKKKEEETEADEEEAADEEAWRSQVQILVLTLWQTAWEILSKGFDSCTKCQKVRLFWSGQALRARCHLHINRRIPKLWRPLWGWYTWVLRSNISHVLISWRQHAVYSQYAWLKGNTAVKLHRNAWHIIALHCGTPAIDMRHRSQTCEPSQTLWQAFRWRGQGVRVETFSKQGGLLRSIQYIFTYPPKPSRSTHLQSSEPDIHIWGDASMCCACTVHCLDKNSLQRLESDWFLVRELDISAASDGVGQAGIIVCWGWHVVFPESVDQECNRSSQGLSVQR